MSAAGLGAAVCTRGADHHSRIGRTATTNSSSSSSSSSRCHGEGSARSAHKLLSTWISGQWIPTVEEFPPVSSIDEAYAIHAAMATDPLVQQLGGVAGWKMGGVGQVAGVAAAYGPLFGCGVVNAPDGLSYSSFNLFNLEAEFGFIMGRELEPRDAPFTQEEVWTAVGEMVLCLELCGKRHSITAPPSNLLGLADCSSAGGVVCGPRFPPSAVTSEQMRTTETQILVNGQV